MKLTTTENKRDYKFAVWLTENIKVVTIPPSVFFSEEHAHIGEDYLRFCYIKVS